ncbi:MAG: hypothetical protein JZU65_10765 [Chlorobium sp.]|nr:hypothetical protein [Chlorobium sp.]
MLLDSPIPEKFPIGQFAVIICKRCKKRYQLSFIISHGNAVEHHVCPRCHSFITVMKSNDVALDTCGQGNIIGTFTLSPNLKPSTYQPSL